MEQYCSSGIDIEMKHLLPIRKQYRYLRTLWASKAVGFLMLQAHAIKQQQQIPFYINVLL